LLSEESVKERRMRDGRRGEERGRRKKKRS
jgi:hypothetical protein